MWGWCDMLYLLLCHVGCKFCSWKWLSIVCKKCSCRTILYERLLELGYVDFYCFLGHLEEEVVLMKESHIRRYSFWPSKKKSVAISSQGHLYINVYGFKMIESCDVEGLQFFYLVFCAEIEFGSFPLWCIIGACWCCGIDVKFWKMFGLEMVTFYLNCSLVFE